MTWNCYETLWNVKISEIMNKQNLLKSFELYILQPSSYWAWSGSKLFTKVCYQQMTKVTTSANLNQEYLSYEIMYNMQPF